jgi:hypothetical protein
MRGKVLWPHEKIRILSMNTLDSTVLTNHGNREVFISHLLLGMPGRSTDWVVMRLDFQEALLPGHFLCRSFAKSDRAGRSQIVRGVKPDEFQNLISRAVHGEPCLQLTMFSAHDSQLREITKMAGPQLNTFEVGGYIEYWLSESDQSKQLPIKGVGVVYSQCKS